MRGGFYIVCRVFGMRGFEELLYVLCFYLREGERVPEWCYMEVGMEETSSKRAEASVCSIPDLVFTARFSFQAFNIRDLFKNLLYIQV